MFSFLKQKFINNSDVMVEFHQLFMSLKMCALEGIALFPEMEIGSYKNSIVCLAVVVTISQGWVSSALVMWVA